MLEVAKGLPDPLVIADNDPMGIATAQKITPRYWVGEVNEDFNDAEQRLGTAAVSESLRGFI